MTEQEFEKLLQSIDSNVYVDDYLKIVVRNINGDTDGDTIIIDDNKTLLLVEALKNNNYITKIDLSFNDITDIGAIALASIDRLKELELYCNQIKVDGVTALAQSNLKTLNLGGNAFLKQVAPLKKIEIMNYFIQNKTITDLNLDYCIFSNEVIAELIRNNTTLKKLSLVDNNLNDECLKFIGNNITLEDLFLSCNHITNNVIEFVLQNNTLRNLNLGNNHLTIEGVKSLIGGNLDYLSIWNNDIPLEALYQFEQEFEEGKKNKELMMIEENEHSMDIEIQESDVSHSNNWSNLSGENSHHDELL